MSRRLRGDHALRTCAAHGGRGCDNDCARRNDRVSASTGREGSKLHRKYGIYLDFVTIAAVPEDYDQRLAEILPGTLKRLRLFALDPYDLALAKLERNIQRDRDDVKYLARTVPFDLNVLRERYEKELRPNLGNPEREDLTLRLWVEALEEELKT